MTDAHSFATINTSKKLGQPAQAFNTQGETRTMKSIEVAYTVLIDDEDGFNGPTHVEVTYGPRGNDGRWAIEVSAIVKRQGFMRTVSYHEAIRVVSAIYLRCVCHNHHRCICCHH